MNNQPYRKLDHERDIKSIQRTWIECGWIDNEERELGPSRTCSKLVKPRSP